MSTDDYCDGCGEREVEWLYNGGDYEIRDRNYLKRFYHYSGYTRPKVLGGTEFCGECAIGVAVDVAQETEEAALRALGPDIEGTIRAETIRVLSDGKQRSFNRICRKLQSLWKRDSAAEEHIVLSMIVESLNDVSDPMPPTQGRAMRKIKQEFRKFGEGTQNKAGTPAPAEAESEEDGQTQKKART